MAKMVGREQQIVRIKQLAGANKSSFIVVYGRRRVGKTFLIRNLFEGQFSFYVTGVANIKTSQQLINFHLVLEKYFPQATIPRVGTWLEAFQQLAKLLEKNKKEKKIIFIDELPWFDTAQSGFVPALEHFWNSWASQRNDVLLIACGSAASWMLNKLINNTGGLYNRVTDRIKLNPFTLAETGQFFYEKKSAFDRYQIIQLYMALGGIPYYLEMVETSLSAAQNIDKLCFDEDAPLKTEFTILYNSLFRKAHNHIAIIEALSKSIYGIGRNELLDLAGLPNGGGSTRLLQELEESDFIIRSPAFGKTGKNSLYRLTDFYSLFYLKFIKQAGKKDRHQWITKIDSPDYRAWSGYAFEQICITHIEQIKKALGISGIQSYTSSWQGSTDKQRAQVEMLIDRRDHVINLCEIKFSLHPFTIDKKYSAVLRNKINVFKQTTGTKKAIYLSFITTYGITKNEYAGSLVQNDLTMDILFEK